MAEAIVSDWLSDYAALKPAELRSFAAEHENNHEIAHSLFTIINERAKYAELLHSACHQLCSFYRSGDAALRKFTLQFLPSLIYMYLNGVAQGDKKSGRSIETLLVCIYNIEISTETGAERKISFRMPILAQASVYHECKQLNASDLRRWEENSNKDVQWGPQQPVEAVNAQNRLKVMSALLFVYNQQLALIPKAALAHLCRVASQIATQGFSRPGHAHRSSYGSDPSQAIAPKPLPRIPVCAPFLVELLHSVYFAMFNDFGSIAIQSVDDIHQRGSYELLPEVILVSNAVRNSLHANPSGQPNDGPMGISVALTPATTTVTVSKSMITNASFRTKKLPDDIPIQTLKADGSPATPTAAAGPGSASGGGGAQASGSAATPLLSITEEGGSDGDAAHLGHRNAASRSSSGSKADTPKVHKAPFSAFMSSKSKDKDAAKAAASNASRSVSNGSVSVADKDVGRSASSHRKEKFVNRNSIGATLQISGDSMDSGCSQSPASIVKRHIDFGTVATSPVGVPMQTLNNGFSGSASGDLNGSADFADGASMISGADAFGESKRVSVVETIKVHTTSGMLPTAMQVSQV